MKYPLFIFLILLFGWPHFIKAQRISLRTNLLLWATTTPNAGIEYAPARNLTLVLTGAYNAWKLPNDIKLNLYLIQPEVRYWFCREFEGHFIGVYGQYGHYNIGQIPFISTLKEHVLRGEFYAGGLTYGYHWAIGDRWGMEFAIGAGYAYMPYEKFRCAECGERMGKFTRSYVGPTRVSLALHYFIR